MARPRQRRDAILAAALHEFNASGIEAAAIGAIGARAGASIGSLYHHFGSKEGLAVALLAEGLRSNARALEVRLRKARGARAGIHAVVDSLIRWIAAHPDWARYIYTVSSSAPAQLHSDDWRAANDFHRGVVDAYFAPLLRAGEFRRVPPECFASLVIGPVHHFAAKWLNGQVAGKITDHVEVFAEAAWAAVRRGG